ncbi:hypothetical protein O9993_01930 [Vibrio lentus]|nr:hypothetical protein [Vibrio lentus]
MKAVLLLADSNIVTELERVRKSFGGLVVQGSIEPTNTVNLGSCRCKNGAVFIGVTASKPFPA